MEINAYFGYCDKHVLSVNPTDTISEVKKKFLEKLNLNFCPERFITYIKGQKLDLEQENHTLADYGITNNGTINFFQGFHFTISFEGDIYTMRGIGCVCCSRKNVFQFMEKMIGIPKESFYIENGSEKIEEKDLVSEKVKLSTDEFVMKVKKDIVIKIKIKIGSREFFIYCIKPLNYDKLFEMIARGHLKNLKYIKDYDNPNLVSHTKNNFIKKFNLKFCDRTIDKKEKLNFIENMNELKLVFKKKK